MIPNPIALVFQPARVLLFVLGLASSITALSTLDFDVEEAAACDASDVSRVELLR